VSWSCGMCRVTWSDPMLERHHPGCTVGPSAPPIEQYIEDRLRAVLREEIERILKPTPSTEGTT
jgi:hypothetical protein